jgi:hypothetical protein
LPEQTKSRLITSFLDAVFVVDGGQLKTSKNIYWKGCGNVPKEDTKKFTATYTNTTM